MSHKKIIILANKFNVKYADENDPTFVGPKGKKQFVNIPQQNISTVDPITAPGDVSSEQTEKVANIISSLYAEIGMDYLALRYTHFFKENPLAKKDLLLITKKIQTYLTSLNDARASQANVAKSVAKLFINFVKDHTHKLSGLNKDIQLFLKEYKKNIDETEHVKVFEVNSISNLFNAADNLKNIIY
jgi:hypothetical protein